MIEPKKRRLPWSIREARFYDQGDGRPDRYLAVFTDRPYGQAEAHRPNKLYEALAVPNDPAEAPPEPYVAVTIGKHLGKELQWEELPKAAQTAIRNDVQAYRRYERVQDHRLSRASELIC